MIITINEMPRALAPKDNYCIGRPISATAVSMPSVDRINWLLAQGQGPFFSGCWTTSESAVLYGRIYHHPAANSRYVLAHIVYDACTKAGSTLEFTPDSGGGTPVTLTVDDTTSGTRFASGAGWRQACLVVPIAATTEQYTEIDCDGVNVRHLTMWDVPRCALDSATDSVLEPRYGARSGYWPGRMVTNSTVAGVEALYDAAVIAKATARRSFGWLAPSAEAWHITTAAADTYEQIGLTELDVDAGWGFRHQARQLKSTDTSKAYNVFALVKGGSTEGSGANLMLTSANTSDTAESAVLQTDTSYEWVKLGSTLLIDATAQDTLIPEVKAGADEMDIYLRALFFVEA